MAIILIEETVYRVTAKQLADLRKRSAAIPYDGRFASPCSLGELDLREYADGCIARGEYKEVGRIQFDLLNT